MSERLTVELSDELAQRARNLASATNRTLEDAVVEWIGRAVAEPTVESLADDELLSLCDLMMDNAEQDELSDLLDRSKDGPLSTSDRSRLDTLTATYRRGLVLKARAWKEAVVRGLRPAPVDDDAA
jgi:hypothetical protein